MKINTGQGTIPLITLIGIWSISALTSLPGLAVSPILGELSTIFPHATELDIQMLTSLPSLLIIPFVLLAGKLAEKRDFIRLLRVGLWLFAASGVLYLFSSKMWQLMAVSALLGIGAGLIIPLSTGLISRYFTGEYRVKQFGYSSAITNMTLVVATAVTGYLAEVHWRLPFVVYLLPLISLVLSAYLKKNTVSVTVKQASAVIPSMQSAPVISGKYGIHIRHLIQLMLFYGVVTYVVLAVTFNLPFLMEAHHFSSGNSGLMISLFFLAIMAPGFMLDNIVKLLGNKTKLYSLLAVAVGLLLIWISPTEWLIVPGCILVGLGYGIIQPLIYDKTVDTAIPQKTTLALAFVMVMNYLAILLSPFITDFFQWVFHTGSQEFPFIFNLCITILTMYWAYAKKGDFLFDD
ncbi:transporter major facilitator family protein [Bacteroides clarus CAG:160]|uniref:MFS transporter n=1 Tax=Bacteroides clarus TaxID=626929 RepID=A0A412N7G6_9BACE|nr:MULTISPECIES: MFS transporter [Bacteroides]RGT34515.1 MFS transporter [Bacteroides clarus]CDB84131.1 transporter major facilitator family protein [Bacteroides clarus CAG:160]